VVSVRIGGVSACEPGRELLKARPKVRPRRPAKNLAGSTRIGEEDLHFARSRSNSFILNGDRGLAASQVTAEINKFSNGNGCSRAELDGGSRTDLGRSHTHKPVDSVIDKCEVSAGVETAESDLGRSTHHLHENRWDDRSE
jgi:hypothetical protein